MSEPCEPFPEDGQFKTNARYCDDCKTYGKCWVAYKRWEERVKPKKPKYAHVTSRDAVFLFIHDAMDDYTDARIAEAFWNPEREAASFRVVLVTGKAAGRGVWYHIDQRSIRACLDDLDALEAFIQCTVDEAVSEARKGKR